MRKKRVFPIKSGELRCWNEARWLYAGIILHERSADREIWVTIHVCTFAFQWIHWSSCRPEHNVYYEFRWPKT